MRPTLQISLILLLAWSCQKSGVIQQRNATKTMYPDQESWTSTLIISRQDLMVARADSDRMIKYNNRDQAYLIGNVSIDFYNKDGQHISHMLADSANINMSNNDLNAIGSVVVRSDSGLVLHTDTLHWNDQYDMINTEDSIMFTTPSSDTLYGIGFESDVDLTHWKIFKPWGVTERGFNVVD